jgi:hypothetical protein
VAGRSALNAALAMSPMTISIKSPPRRPKAAPTGNHGGDLERHPMNVEVVRLIVGVLHRPQLGRVGSDHAVDPRHFHLLTVDLATVQLERPAGCHMIKPSGAIGVEPLRKTATLAERMGSPKLD